MKVKLKEDSGKISDAAFNAADALFEFIQCVDVYDLPDDLVKDSDMQKMADCYALLRYISNSA